MNCAFLAYFVIGWQEFTPFFYHRLERFLRMIIEKNATNVSKKIHFDVHRIEKLKENRDLCFVEHFYMITSKYYKNVINFLETGTLKNNLISKQMTSPYQLYLFSLLAGELNYRLGASTCTFQAQRPCWGEISMFITWYLDLKRVWQGENRTKSLKGTIELVSKNIDRSVAVWSQLGSGRWLMSWRIVHCFDRKANISV